MICKNEIINRFCALIRKEILIIMKKQIKQPCKNKRVHVIVSLRRGQAIAISKDKNYKSVYRPFKGTSIDGFETNNLSSKRIELIQ